MGTLFKEKTYGNVVVVVVVVVVVAVVFTLIFGLYPIQYPVPYCSFLLLKVNERISVVTS